MRTLYGLVVTFVVLGIIVSISPAVSFAQEQGIERQIERMKQDYRDAAESVSAQVLNRSDTINTPGIVNSGCWLYGSMDEEGVPQSELYYNFIITGGGSPQGNFHYTTMNNNQHARFTVVGSNFPEDQPHYGQVWLRSARNQRLILSEVTSVGNIWNQHEVLVPGDNTWHQYTFRIDRPILTISSEDGAPRFDLDAFQVWSCESNFSYLPGVGQGDIPCPDEQTGRMKASNESNERVEDDMRLIRGSVTNPPGKPNVACWDVVQTWGRNPHTGEIVDFMGENRNTFTAVAFVPYNAITGQALPWWATRVIAVTSETAGLAVRHLVTISPWALLLGVAIGVVWFGWSLYLIAEDVKSLYSPFTYDYGTYQQLASTQVIADNIQFYLYRLEDSFTQTWFDKSKMMAVLQTNEDSQSATGFIISTQASSNAYIETPHSYRALTIVQDMVAQRENAWSEPTPKFDAKEMADAVDEWLRGERPVPVDPNPSRECSDTLSVIQIANDVQLYEEHVWIGDKAVITEMLEALYLNQYMLSYSNPRGNWTVGTDLHATFNDYVFPDGKMYQVEYYCGSLGGYPLWIFLQFREGNEVLPYQ